MSKEEYVRDLDSMATEEFGFTAEELDSLHDALEEAFGTRPVPMGGGGSIPIVVDFEETLDASAVAEILHDVPKWEHAEDGTIRLRAPEAVQSEGTYAAARTDHGT